MGIVFSDAFDPETTQALVKAFEAACEELGGNPQGTSFSAEATRELVASRLIEAARCGIRNPDTLRQQALLNLSVRLRKKI